jgi:uncharacterized protein YgfB (UPF0149 family)
MSDTPVLPNYQDVTTALQNSGSEISAAEAHGLLCGMIASTPPAEIAGWEKVILGKLKNADSKSLLQKLYSVSHKLLNEFSFEFTLLLPDDDDDINERTENLGLWCQGFLVGMQQGPLSLPADASEDALEAMDDLAEIGQVSFGELGKTDEDEAAYLELVEYVRLSTLMLYHEIQITAPADTSKDHLLH